VGWKLKTLATVIVIGAIGAVVDDDEDPTASATDAPPAASAEPSATPPPQEKWAVARAELMWLSCTLTA